MSDKIYDVPADWAKRAYVDDAKYRGGISLVAQPVHHDGCGTVGVRWNECGRELFGRKSGTEGKSSGSKERERENGQEMAASGARAAGRRPRGGQQVHGGRGGVLPSRTAAELPARETRGDELRRNRARGSGTRKCGDTFHVNVGATLPLTRSGEEGSRFCDGTVKLRAAGSPRHACPCGN